MTNNKKISKKAVFELPDPEKAKVQTDFRNSAVRQGRKEKLQRVKEKILNAELPVIYCRITRVHRFSFISVCLLMLAFFNELLFEINPISPMILGLLNSGLLLFIVFVLLAPYKNNRINADQESITFPSVIFPNKSYCFQYQDISNVEIRTVHGMYGHSNHLYIHRKGKRAYRIIEFYLQGEKFRFQPGEIYRLKQFIQDQVTLVNSRKNLSS